MMHDLACSTLSNNTTCHFKCNKRKWATPGKQDWRYGMNQSGIKGAKILVNLDTTKGVIAY